MRTEVWRGGTAASNTSFAPLPPLSELNNHKVDCGVVWYAPSGRRHSGPDDVRATRLEMSECVTVREERGGEGGRCNVMSRR